MGLLSNTTLNNMFVFDLETVTNKPSYTELPTVEKTLWNKVAKRFLKEDELLILDKNIECYRKNAGLFPEFSKIVSVAVGLMKGDFKTGQGTQSVVKNITLDDEKTLLLTFVKGLNEMHEKNPSLLLAGHNIAGFDIPFLVKRLIFHRISIPTLLIRCVEAKPWDQPVYDTIRVWKFGSSEFVSLDNMCNFLGIESPKTGVVTGETLSAYYYDTTIPRETVLQNIGLYNKADVVAVQSIVKELVKL